MMDRFNCQCMVNNIELILSGVGVVVTLAVPLLFTPGAHSEIAFWQLMSGVALAVGVIHGCIFWIVRRRQRVAREQSIEEIREMLSDVVKNQLAVIDMYLPAEQRAIVEEELDGIRTSIHTIAQEVDSISEDSIEEWKEKYGETLATSTDLEPVVA